MSDDEQERDSKPWRSGMPPLQTRDAALQRAAVDAFVRDGLSAALADALHEVDDEVQFIRRDARDFLVLSARIAARIEEARK